MAFIGYKQTNKETDKLNIKLDKNQCKSLFAVLFN